MNLTEEQRKDLNEFYWETDMSTKELKDHFKLSGGVHKHVQPLRSGAECPNCQHPMFFTSRTARNSSKDVCRNCNHKNLYFCRCDHCMALKEEQREREAIERKRQQVEAYEKLLKQVAKEEYVLWSLSRLSRRDKIFFRTLLQFEKSDSPTWEWKEICDSAQVVSHVKYVIKLSNLHLLLDHPEGYLLSNPAVDVGMISIQKARNISNSLRFDVFQRDYHTCQYCGRKAPHVELQVDHLIPVAKDGTDDFDNLVTSCQDCNSGKSTKLIESFTKGYSREEWREELRNQRMQLLEEKREKLEEVVQYWAECRNTYHPSDYDLEAIYDFIERYEPEWIKVAIQIAVSQHPSPSNYAKYVGGILRNWGKNGPPHDIANLKLGTRKATEKQIKFIRDLLNQNNLDLMSFYGKSDYNELTMLDARDIIDALTKPQ